MSDSIYQTIHILYNDFCFYLQLDWSLDTADALELAVKTAKQA
jgi:hypothetical protein